MVIHYEYKIEIEKGKKRKLKNSRICKPGNHGWRGKTKHGEELRGEGRERNGKWLFMELELN